MYSVRFTEQPRPCGVHAIRSSVVCMPTSCAVRDPHAMCTAQRVPDAPHVALRTFIVDDMPCMHWMSPCTTALCP